MMILISASNEDTIFIHVQDLEYNKYTRNEGMASGQDPTEEGIEEIKRRQQMYRVFNLIWCSLIIMSGKNLEGMKML